MHHDSYDTDYGHPDTPSDRTRHNLEKIQLLYIEEQFCRRILCMLVFMYSGFAKRKIFSAWTARYHSHVMTFSFPFPFFLPTDQPIVQPEGDGKKIDVMDMVIFPWTENQVYLQTWCKCRAMRTSYVSSLCMWIPNDHFLPFVEIGPLILLSVIASNTRLNNQNGITSFPDV